jgi:hypothetical protein
MRQSKKRTIGKGWIAAAGTTIVYLLAFMLLTTGCGGPSNEEMLKTQVNELTEQTNGQSATIEEQEKTIADLQGQIKDQDETISSLEKEKEEQGKALEELRKKAKALEDENQQTTQLLQSISEIPERYKEVFVKTSELQFVATLFNQDIRALKVDSKNNKVTDLRTDTELELKGIHNSIEGSYGYEFTMEEFLEGDTSIAINGDHYSIVGMPTMLETKAMDGKVSLYDICQTLVVLRAEKNGQFVYSTQY